MDNQKKDRKLRSANMARRKGIENERDPYLNKEEYPDPAVCKRCRALYHGKKWIHPDLAGAVLPAAEKKEVLCPACLKIKENYPEGFLTLEGAFLNEHKEEVLNLIRNKEDIAARINPLERIIEIKERPAAIEITTTTEKLAQRIGQILKKAFQGDVAYKWSGDTKLARVTWVR